MKCPNCNAEVTGRFCEYCGSELSKEKTVTNINNNSKTIINNYYSKKQLQGKQVRETKTELPKHRKNNYKFEGVGVTILWLLFFFPVGIIRMWSKKEFPKFVRIIITAFFILIIIATLVSPSDNQINENPISSQSETSTQITHDHDSIKDAFQEGIKDGIGDSAEENKEDIKENVDDIKESINYIFSE